MSNTYKVTVVHIAEPSTGPGHATEFVAEHKVFEQTFEDFNLSRFVSDLNKPKRRRAPASKPQAS